jgi:hypothetical protein
MNAPAETAAIEVTPSAIGARPEGLARRLGRASMATIVASCVVSFVASIAYPSFGAASPFDKLIGLLYLLSAGLLAVTALTNLWCWIAPRRTGSIGADGASIRVSRGFGVRVIPRGKIHAGWLSQSGAEHEVELRLASGDVVSATVRSKHEADALLDAAGVASDKRALSMRLGGAGINTLIALAALLPGMVAGSLVALSLGALVQLPSAALGFMIFTVMALAPPAALWLVGAPQVDVGDDGVSVNSGSRKRFIAFSDVVAVTTTPFSVVLELRDGRKDEIRTLGTKTHRRDALVARIREEIASASAPRSLSDRVAMLDRNGRTMEAWAEALRAVLDEGDAYRHTGLTRTELTEVLDDPLAPAERRIAAAYVLSRSDKGDAAERVRVVIEGTAQEPVRVALARAAEGALDEEAIAAAEQSRVRVEAR